MGILDRLQGVVGGMALVGSGVIVSSVLPNMIKEEKLKLIPQLAGLGIVGYGGYVIYQTMVRPAEWISAGESLTVSIETPNPMDKWTYGSLYSIVARIINPYSKRITFKGYMYMANESGEYYISEGRRYTIEPQDELILKKDWISVLGWTDSGVGGRYAVSIVIHDIRGEDEPGNHGIDIIQPTAGVWVGY